MDDQQTPKEDSQSIMDRLGALWRVIMIPLAAVLLALIIGAILLAISGANPFSAYSALIEEPLVVPLQKLHRSSLVGWQ